MLKLVVQPSYRAVAKQTNEPHDENELLKLVVQPSLRYEHLKTGLYTAKFQSCSKATNEPHDVKEMLKPITQPRLKYAGQTMKRTHERE